MNVKQVLLTKRQVAVISKKDCMGRCKRYCRGSACLLDIHDLVKVLILHATHSWIVALRTSAAAVNNTGCVALVSLQYRLIKQV